MFEIKGVIRLRTDEVCHNHLKVVRFIHGSKNIFSQWTGIAPSRTEEFGFLSLLLSCCGYIMTWQL